METLKRTYWTLLVLVGFWCAGTLLAPLLSSALPGVSKFLYSFYSPICHQMDSHSLHVPGGKAGVCARCFAIYWGFFGSLLLYPTLRTLNASTLPSRGWIIIAVGPMLLDVLLTLSGLHESTLVTRTLTGALFGLIMPFYLLPPLLEGVAQLRTQYLARGGLFYARKTQ